MKKFLITLFNLEEHEFQLVSLQILQSFLIGLPKVFTVTVAHTLFLKHYSAENLPFIYIIAALIMPIAGYTFLQAEEKLPLLSVLRWTLLIDCFFLLLFWTLVYFVDSPWVVVCLPIWFKVEYTLGNMVYWGTATQMFTLREAKKLFGLISTGEMLAKVMGAGIISILVLHLDTIHLLVFSFWGMYLAYINLGYMGKKFPEKFHHQDDDEDEHHHDHVLDLFKIDYVLIIFSLSALAYMAYYFMDNAFYKVAQEHFSDSKKIAAFIGQFMGMVGIISFVIKAFVSGRLLHAIGVGASLLIAPVTLLLLAAIVAFAGLLKTSIAVLFWMVVTVKLCERVLFDSINKPAAYTLYQPLTPERRGAVKTTVDTFIGPFAGLLASFFLLILGKGLGSGGPAICGSLVVICLVWVYSAYRSSEEYQKTLAGALKSRMVTRGEISLDDPQTLKILVQGLESSRSMEVIHCLDLLEEAGPPDFSAHLLRLQKHEDPGVRLEVYKKIEKSGKEIFFQGLAEDLKHEENPVLRMGLLRALAATGEMKAFPILSPLTQSKVMEEKLGAMVGLLHYCGIEGSVHSGYEILRLQRSDSPQERGFAARVIAEIGLPNLYQGLVELLSDSSPRVRLNALKAASILKNPKLWSHVVPFLEEPALRNAAIAALKEGGEEVIQLFREKYYREDSSQDLKECIIYTLGKMRRKPAMDFLARVLFAETNPDLFYTNLKALHNGQFQATLEDRDKVEILIRRELDFATRILSSTREIQLSEDDLLNSALLDEFHSARERIFLLLSFLYSPRTIKKVEKNLDLGTEKKRAYAVELLEYTVTREHLNLFLPLIDDLNLEARFARLIKRFPQLTLTSEERLKEIALDREKWPGFWPASCALAYLNPSQLKTIETNLIKNLRDENPILREISARALQSISPDAKELVAVENLDATPTMSRIRFLKKISIFGTIPDELLTHVAGVIKEITLPAGKLLFKKGDMGNSMFIIFAGRVKIHYAEKTLAEPGEGEIFGELAALDTEARTASVTGVEDTLLFEISQNIIYQLIGIRFQVGLGIIKVLCRKINTALQKPENQKRPSRIIDGSPKKSEHEHEHGHQQEPEGVSMIEKMLILKTASIFSNTPDNILTEIADLSRERRVSMGETIFSQGEHGTEMFIIVEGKISIHDEKGGEIAVLGERAILGEMATLVSEPRNASATALVDCRLLSLKQSALHDVMWGRAEVTRGIIKVLVKRVRSVL
ncbi:cyclic nucleotide-binding domain-containing protein [Candidatus Riflebacteria bacterium]